MRFEHDILRHRKEMGNIIHYNPHRNWPISRLRNKYVSLGLDYDFPFIDRSESIPHYLDIKPISKPLRFDKSFNYSFYDIITGQSLIILGLGLKVNILWSGGLDSTAALVALLSNAKDKNQIRIVANYNSIIESGYLYDTFFKKYDCIIDTSGGRQSFKNDELYITGALGNQLFSLGSFELKHDIKDLNKPYKEVINPKEFEFLESAMEFCPRPIETLEDYLWFKTYMFKWDHQRLAMINKWIQPKSVKEHLYFIRGFYYNELFEQWSIHRSEQQHDLKNYEYTSKLPMRKYILKELGKEAEDYVWGKKITHSIFTPYRNNYKYTTEDYRVHYDTSL